MHHRMTTKRRGQAHQDAFAYSIAGEQGTYIEIGAFKPATKNNTYGLEVDHGWKGFSLELNIKWKQAWDECLERHNPVCWTDATTFDYLTQVDAMRMPRRINYLSCDIEPPNNTFTALKRVIEQGIEFDCITFEHDKGNPGFAHLLVDNYEQQAIDFLAQYNYRPVVLDVYAGKNTEWFFETWFVKNDIKYPSMKFEDWKVWMGLV
jgi:hypothetical protein